MIKVKMMVSKDVVDQIMKHDQVSAITNFKNAFSERAYRDLATVTGYDNFFFAMKDSDNPDVDQYIRMSDLNNKYEVVAQIPEGMYQDHNYFTFADLIYEANGGDVGETDEETMSRIKKLLKTEPDTGEVRQVVFPVLKKFWIESIKDEKGREILSSSQLKQTKNRVKITKQDIYDSFRTIDKELTNVGFRFSTDSVIWCTVGRGPEKGKKMSLADVDYDMFIQFVVDTPISDPAKVFNDFDSENYNYRLIRHELLLSAINVLFVETTLAKRTELFYRFLLNDKDLQV